MKFPILIAFFLFTAFYILHSTYYIPIVSAQTCQTQPASSPRVINGLITTPNSSFDSTNKFFTDSTGKCITSNQTSFAPFKIPSYADLKSLYFDQNKLPDDRKITLNSTSVIDLGSTSRIYFQAADFTVSAFANIIRDANANNVNPAVIFIRDNLLIDENPGASLAKAGVVFVVGGDVNIARGVTQVDAVIIAQGFIYTAGANCATSSETASALTINGSLISLDSAKPPVFCRNLTGADNNSYPAEKIVQQPKYLVILKDLFADTLQKWSEIQ